MGTILVFHTQIQTIKDPIWQTIPEENLFPMQPFGFRSRAQRLFVEAPDVSRNLFYKELSDWVIQRLQSLSYSKITAIRFIHCGIKVEPSKTSFGAWENLSPETYLYDTLKILYQRELSP